MELYHRSCHEHILTPLKDNLSKSYHTAMLKYFDQGLNFS